MDVMVPANEETTPTPGVFRNDTIILQLANPLTRTTHFSARPGDYNLERNEEQQIINALEQTGWHHGKAASILGISPLTTVPPAARLQRLR